ncbi:MAG: ABC transporter ATP-binding protein [Elusimicrobia bacterium]|nr:ABC transporter ATP-binding protein [Elusimicrobiota bacterium]
MLLALMTVSALVEVAGVASIMPFLSIITTPDIIYDNRLLSFFYSAFNFHSANNFLIFTGVMVLIILIAGNLLKGITLWGMYHFTGGQNFRIAQRLMSKYIHRPYLFFLDKNSSELGKNILSEVSRAVGGVVFPIIHLFSRSFVSVLIFILLFITEPLLAVIVLMVLGSAYYCIYKGIKKKIGHIGRLRFETNTVKYKSVTEAFGGIKQLKLMGCEYVFLQRFSRPSLKYEKYQASFNTISEIPHYIMELVAFGGIMIIVLYLIITGMEIGVFVPIIGLYAFATHRLMPSLQAIFNNITTIRFNRHALNTLYEELNSVQDKQEKIINREDIKALSLKSHLKLDNINFSYPGTNESVITDLNLKIDLSTSVAFVGETGAGKTTVADIILGLLRPQVGRIIADDTEITDDNLKRWQRNLGYIPQEIYLQDDTIANNIAFGVPDDEINRQKITEVAKIANIHDFISNELENGYDTVIGERGIKLSGGQRQRIGIAMALYREPKVLVLDEATNALDSATEAAVFKDINKIEKAMTLIIIAHRLSTVRTSDIIYFFENGKLTASGTYNKLMETNSKFRKMIKVV